MKEKPRFNIIASIQLKLKKITAWKVSEFGVILVRVFPDLEWMRIRITPDTDTFYAANTGFTGNLNGF